MKYQAGTSLADLERGVIEATDAFRDACEIWKTADRDRIEAQGKLEKAQQALDEAFSDLRSRAPGGLWATSRVNARLAGPAAVERALARQIAAE